jgi:uncharacterized protein YjbI with pentapeptide repeats
MSNEIKIEKKASDVIQPVTGSDARKAIRARQDLSGAILCGMQLENLHATGAILRKTDLAAADLSHGLLVNPNFYRASLYGAAVHNTVFLGGDLVKTSFKEADLSDSALIGVDAQKASFEGANLRNAALINANLEDTVFTDANLTNARLVGGNVTGADFTGATFTGARATNIDWTQAKVPPNSIPQPLVKIPTWAWSMLIGGLLGGLALLIYSILRKRKQRS